MSSQALQQPTTTAADEAAIRALYQQMMMAGTKAAARPSPRRSTMKAILSGSMARPARGGVVM